MSTIASNSSYAYVRRAFLFFSSLAAVACGGTETPSLPDAGSDPDGGASGGYVVVADTSGHLASLSLGATNVLGPTATVTGPLGSVRCRGLRCVVVRPAPNDDVVLFRADDLGVIDTFALDRGADPQDAVLLDDDTVVVSQAGRSSLAVITISTDARDAVDLAPLADADGIPEMDRLALCGRKVFVQLGRVDATTGVPDADGSRLAVVDFDRVGAARLVDVDGSTAGTQGVVLAGRPGFDMPVECGAGLLHVSEPKPLFQGGGKYETVSLSTYLAAELPIAGGAEIGGFEVIGGGIYWLVTHTDFGPGASSHLEFVGGPNPNTYNTFGDRHVDDIAFDRPTNRVFFPDPCMVTPSNASCLTGLHVFDATTGVRIGTGPIEVGFPPSEVTLAR